MSPAIPLLIQEGWRAERRGGYLRMEQVLRLCFLGPGFLPVRH